MFKKIVVPVDGSSTSSLALEKAAALAEAFSGSVLVVSVIDNYAFTGVGVDFAYGQAEYLKAATEESNQAIAAAKKAFEARGIPVTSALVEGHAIYKGIVDAAESFQADLIVMGSHGRKGLEKLVLGSVASQVLSNVKLSVLIVHETSPAQH